MGYSKSKYNDCIYNSLELSDELLDLYGDDQIVRDSKINTILDTSLNESAIILKYPSYMKDELDKNSNMEFIGVSRLDNSSPIYKIKIPKGYQIVDSVDSILKS